MDVLNNVLSWLGSGLTGSILGIIGIVIGAVSSFNHHRVTHYSRQKYKKAVLRKIDLILMYQGLKRDNMSSVIIIQILRNIIFRMLICCTLLISTVIFFTSTEFEPKIKGIIALILLPAAFFFNWKAISSSFELDDHVEALTLPREVIFRIYRELESGKGAILTEADKMEIDAKILKIADPHETPTIETV